MKTLLMVLLTGFAMQALADDLMVSAVPPTSPGEVSGAAYQKRLPMFSDSFDLSKRKVYVDETYFKEISDEAKKVFAQKGFVVVGDPNEEDVQIIMIEEAKFDFKRGDSNWIDVDYIGLSAKYADNRDGLQKYLEGLRPPSTIGVDAGVLFGSTVAAITGAARGALSNSDFKKGAIPFDQAMTLKVSVLKIAADGKTVHLKTIKPNVNTKEGGRFLVDPSELYAAAIDCLITCK
jgi:hypothetical protein